MPENGSHISQEWGTAYSRDVAGGRGGENGVGSWGGDVAGLSHSSDTNLKVPSSSSLSSHSEIKVECDLSVSIQRIFISEQIYIVN